MSIQVLPIYRTINNYNSSEFDAFNFSYGQDHYIRWLSRPNQQFIRERYGPGSQKFHITFDAENFQPEQIKVDLKKRLISTKLARFPFRSIFKTKD